MCYTKHFVCTRGYHRNRKCSQDIEGAWWVSACTPHYKIQWHIENRYIFKWHTSICHTQRNVSKKKCRQNTQIDIKRRTNGGLTVSTSVGQTSCFKHSLVRWKTAKHTNRDPRKFQTLARDLFDWPQWDFDHFMTKVSILSSDGLPYDTFLLCHHFRLSQ